MIYTTIIFRFWWYLFFSILLLVYYWSIVVWDGTNHHNNNISAALAAFLEDVSSNAVESDLDTTTIEQPFVGTTRQEHKHHLLYDTKNDDRVDDDDVNLDDTISIEANGLHKQKQYRNDNTEQLKRMVIEQESTCDSGNCGIKITPELQMKGNIDTNHYPVNRAINNENQEQVVEDQDDYNDIDSNQHQNTNIISPFQSSHFLYQMWKIWFTRFLDPMNSPTNTILLNQNREQSQEQAKKQLPAVSLQEEDTVRSSSSTRMLEYDSTTGFILSDVNHVFRSIRNMVATEIRSKICFQNKNIISKYNINNNNNNNNDDIPTAVTYSSSSTSNDNNDQEIYHDQEQPLIADDDEISTTTAVDYKSNVYQYLDHEPEECQFLDNDIDDNNDNNESNENLFINDDVCIVLNVYSYHPPENNQQNEIEGTRSSTQQQKLSYQYELLDPIELELGITVPRHAHDFAYMPVMLSTSSSSSSSFSSSSVVEDSSKISKTKTLFEKEMQEQNNNDETNLPERLEDIHHDGSKDYSDFTSINEVEVEDTSLVQEVSPEADHQWWKWLIPSHWWKNNIMKDRDQFTSSYRVNHEAFAGGSHGEVWRGRRKCNVFEQRQEQQWGGTENNLCGEKLIFKRLKVEAGYHTLEAGLREVYFGGLLSGATTTATTTKSTNNNNNNHENDENQVVEAKPLFTQYVDHFFGERGELWIVFRDAGPSLRSYLYTATKAADCVLFQHSWFWTLLRMSVAKKKRIETNNNNYSERNRASDTSVSVTVVDSTAERNSTTNSLNSPSENEQLEGASLIGRELMRSVLRQILEAVSFLHENEIIHRDIKPSNVMCQTNFDPEKLQSLNINAPEVRCVLGDFSSAYNEFTRRNLYIKGPSRAEQTDEYAPPEAIFGNTYNKTSSTLTAAFDSWSIGIVALELLLGTPNVFSVDQRTRVILSHKMQKQGATQKEIQKAMYLAALSQFCIYNPRNVKGAEWPLRDGDPLYNSAMTKQSCTLNDFHRALRARDPLGWGFNKADNLLHLIWQLLAWNPEERITASEALKHPYFTTLNVATDSIHRSQEASALQSQMLDPRMDFNLSDSVSEFRCPKCGRTFGDWKSCLTHANSRKHAKFCTYDKDSLPTCLNAHSMLPAHSNSGYCDIQGRRPSIEDFHAIHLMPLQQFYGIFDGHLGNLASKYAASFLHKELASRLDDLLLGDVHHNRWKEKVEMAVSEAFHVVHDKFLEALALAPFGFMDNSGTTATTVIVTNTSVVIASLGDSRAVISSRKSKRVNVIELTAVQLTKDHQANDPEERLLVESRGGNVVRVNGVDRVNGVLVITRSIGDSNLANVLSRQPQVLAMTREEVSDICGSRRVVDNTMTAVVDNNITNYPCFLIVASDGLWDKMSNQEAVDMVAQVIAEETINQTRSFSPDEEIRTTSWHETAAFQRAAEALTLESYVRGSTDNIGVCIIALDG